MRKTTSAPAAACLALLFFAAADFATAQSDTAGEAKIDFNIPSQSLADALAEWSRQCGLQVLLRDADGADLVAAGVDGKFSPAEALEKLIAASGLTYEFVNERTVRIVPARNNATEQDKATSSDSARSSEGAGAAHGIPEILVEGSKILNTDIARSNDDPQPYVIFDRARIEHSAAATLDDFFKQRLPMNAAGRSATQTPSAFGASSIDLRGLGANQTLILIDGRRMANATFNGQPQQPDLTAIPLAAIERIEVLPTTASGIYGGGATGGVINIILRRDYTGVETKLTYDSAVDGAAGRYRADVNAGFSLEDGRTNVMLAMGYSDGDALFTRDRDLFTRGRDAIRRNNFAAYLAPNNPPLGATSNIRSADGSNLTLKDGTPLGSPITFVPAGYAGASSDAGAALLANAGSYNFGLPPTNQRFGGQTDLISIAPELRSFLGTVRREFSARVQAFLEGSVTSSTLRYPYSNAQATFTVPAAALTNPFGQSVVVTVPVDTVDEEQIQRNRNNRVVGGVIVKLGHRWTGEIDYTWTQSRWSQLTPTVPPVVAPVANGTLDVFRDTIRYPLDYATYALPPGRTLDPQLTTLKNITLRASGPLFSLPAGDLVLSAFVERSDRKLDGGLIRSQNTSTTVATSLVPPRTQDVDTVYVELRAPLTKSLELQVGGRHDEYSTEAPDRLIVPQPSTTPIGRVRNRVRSSNPTVALRYQPLQDVALRASWGTGFVAPDVNQLSANLPGTTSGFIDPRRGGAPLPSFQFQTGGNPDLRPEESESFSAGLILTPRFLPALRLSLDYTRIDKTDNIAPLDFQQVLDNEAFLPGRVTRGPNLPTDPAGWAGPVTFLDRTNANIARSKIEAYDLQLDYRIDLAARGSLELQLMATRLANLETQLVPSAPVVQNAGIVPFSNSASLPLKLKANLGVTWTRERWTAGWLGNYFDSYLVANPALSSSTSLFQSQGSRTVSSQMYHDLFASYRFDSSFLRGTEVQLTVRNVLDEEPPLDVSNTLGLYSYLGDPRLASYILSIRHAF